MKIVRKSKDLIQQTFVEISILTHIKEKDKTNISGIVRIKDFLLYRNHIVISNLYLVHIIRIIRWKFILTYNF
jgi:dual specificity tyrosine-phosphorylation-regulated kinase 2/3/4